jgi:hypothetical protein
MYKMEINVSGQRAKVWNRRNLAVAARFAEGPFTIQFAGLHHRAMQTADFDQLPVMNRPPLPLAQRSAQLASQTPLRWNLQKML